MPSSSEAGSIWSTSAMSRRREDPAAMDLEAEVNQLYNDIVNLQEDYQSTVVMPYAEKVLVDFVNDSDIIDNKEQFIKNMKTWLY